MSDFVQHIEYTWLFVLSIPTLYFFAAIVVYRQHLGNGGRYTIPCDIAEKSLLHKSECEIDTLFDTSIGMVFVTQCSFIVCLIVYKKQELKRYVKCGDSWSIFVYT